MNLPRQNAPQIPTVPRASPGAFVRKLLLHTVFLLIALGCLAGYEHFKVEGQSSASLACLVAAGVFGLLPVRDVIRILFGIEGKVGTLRGQPGPRCGGCGAEQTGG